jgi:hypothetical protein
MITPTIVQTAQIIILRGSRKGIRIKGRIMQRMGPRG